MLVNARCEHGHFLPLSATLGVSAVSSANEEATIYLCLLLWAMLSFVSKWASVERDLIMR